MTTDKKPGIFYGWYIVGGLATISMVSVGMGGMNLGLFVEPMNSELGISHTAFGLTQTFRAIGFSISSIFLGRILDKYGARVPMAISAIIMAGILVSMAFIQHGWQLVFLIFMCGFIGLEGAGGNLYTSVPLSRWFIRKRGRAMSIAFMGMTMGLLVFTPLLQYIISNYGWRIAWAGTGSIACFVIFLIAVFVMRKDPESMGLLPDGDVVPKKVLIEDEEDAEGVKPPVASFPGEYSFTRSQALKTASFWGLVVLLGIRMFSMSTILIFRIPYFINSGFDAQLVAFAVSVEALISAAVSIPTGWAMDRFQPRFITAITLALFSVAIVATFKVDSIIGVYVACGLFGLSVASFQIAQNAIWPSYFGGKNIGAIRGVAIPFTVFFGAVGAPFTGWVMDKTGSYIPVWTAAAGLMLVASVIMLVNRKPTPPIMV